MQLIFFFSLMGDGRYFEEANFRIQVEFITIRDVGYRKKFKFIHDKKDVMHSRGITS